MNINHMQKPAVPECLKDYLLVDTRSMEHAHDVAARSFVPHKLRPLRLHSDFHFVHSHAFLQNVSLCYTAYGNELMVEPESMDEFYLIQMSTGGVVEIESGSKQAKVFGMQGSILSPENRTKFRWSEDAGVITIKIDRQALEEQMRRLIQTELTKGIDFKLGMQLTAPEYRNWYIEVLRLMQYFQYTKNAELVSLEGWFEQKLMELLLVSQPSNYSHQLTQDQFHAPSQSVGLAIDYMHQHIVEKITLGKLSNITGVSGRTLHNGFKRFRNVSPLEYLTDIRLQKARSALLKACTDATVTSIAQASGFSHLGRFSQRYFQEFGEHPSDTLRRGNKLI